MGTLFRPGQLVEVTWPNGSAIRGVLVDDDLPGEEGGRLALGYGSNDLLSSTLSCRTFWFRGRLSAFFEGAQVEILQQPKVQYLHGMKVEAAFPDGSLMRGTLEALNAQGVALALRTGGGVTTFQWANRELAGGFRDASIEVLEVPA